MSKNYSQPCVQVLNAICTQTHKSNAPNVSRRTSPKSPRRFGRVFKFISWNFKVTIKHRNGNIWFSMFMVSHTPDMWYPSWFPISMCQTWPMSYSYWYQKKNCNHFLALNGQQRSTIYTQKNKFHSFIVKKIMKRNGQYSHLNKMWFCYVF